MSGRHGDSVLSKNSEELFSVCQIFDLEFIDGFSLAIDHSIDILGHDFNLGCLHRKGILFNNLNRSGTGLPGPRILGQSQYRTVFRNASFDGFRIFYSAYTVPKPFLYLVRQSKHIEGNLRNNFRISSSLKHNRCSWFDLVLSERRVYLPLQMSALRLHSESVPRSLLQCKYRWEYFYKPLFKSGEPARGNDPRLVPKQV